MSNLFDLVMHYPWLPSLIDYYSDYASLSPLDFISEVFLGDHSKDIQERIFDLFKAAFQNLEQIDNYKIDRLNIYVYLILKIILYTLDNKIITNRLANLYSKINYNEMEKENEHNLYYICNDLKLNVLYSEEPWFYGKRILRDMIQHKETHFKIYYIDYLKLASNLKDEYRKLINNSLSNGYVFIQKRELIRLLQEFIRKKLLIEEMSDKASLEAFKKKILGIPKFKVLYDDLLTEWTKKKEEFQYTFEMDMEKVKNISDFYPPCVKEILKKAQEGQNLIHNERLFLVWFLLALNYSVDSIINIFSTIPDFDKKRTTYQVEYAHKKGYTPYKCKSLKTLNLCMAEKYKDELCLEGYGSKDPNERKKISHPLAYIRVKQYRSKFKKKLKKQSKDTNE